MLRLSLSILVFLFFSYSFADNTPPSAEQLEAYQKAKEACELQHGKVYEPVSGAILGKCVNDADRKEDIENCKEAIKAYKDMQGPDSDLGKSCAASGVGSSNSAKCLQIANVCQSCIGEKDEDESDPENGAYCEANDDDEYDEDSEEKVGVNALIAAYKGEQPGRQSRSRKQTRLDARETMLRFKNCPVYAVEMFDEIVEKKEKYDEDVKAAKDDIPELIKALREAEANLKEAQEEQAELLPQYEEDIEDIISSNNEELKAKLEENGKSIVAKILEIQNAEIAFRDNRTKLLQPCFDKAEAELQNLKQRRVDRIRNGQLRSRGGFAGLMAQDNRDEMFQKFAVAIYKDCRKNNPAIKAALRNLEDLNKQNMKVLNLQMDDLKRTQQNIANQMMGSAKNTKLDAQMKQRNKQFKEESKEAAKKVEAALRAYESAKVLLEKRQSELAEAEYLFGVYLDQEKAAKKVGATKGNKGDVSAVGFIQAASSYRYALRTAYDTCKCDDSNSRNSNCGSIESEMRSGEMQIPESTPRNDDGNVNVDQGADS